MTDAATGDGQPLEDFCGFVAYLAKVQLDPRLAGTLHVDDIVQETLLKAHEAAGQFRGRERAQKKAWLRTILLRVMANALRDLRAAKRDLNRERSLDAALDDSSLRLEAFLAAEQSTPSERAQKNEAALKLEEALAELPERQREAL